MLSLTESSIKPIIFGVHTKPITRTKEKALTCMKRVSMEHVRLTFLSSLPQLCVEIKIKQAGKKEDKKIDVDYVEREH